MKRILGLLFAAIILLIGTSFQSVSHAATKYYATVNMKSLSVHEKASSNSKIVGTLNSGAKVTVYVKTKAGWSQIVYKNKKAYVSTKYLHFYTSAKKNKLQYG
jgi:uncharacterized protein YgiM (DUF1202 family)